MEWSWLFKSNGLLDLRKREGNQKNDNDNKNY